MQFGIIGGTGFYDLGGEPTVVETRYGSIRVDRTEVGGAEVAFVPRHGARHGLPPHRVNYRGNIAALRSLGITNVLATAAVGSMSEKLPPGSLALPTQFLDFTRGRPHTFFDGDDGKVVHVDMTDPYCAHLRGELETTADALGHHLRPQAVYVCAEGPRFETPAEIHMFRKLGGDIVGMTGLPEVSLAREAGMCYASVAIVTNWAAGVSKDPIKHGEVSAFMGEQTPRVRAIFAGVIRGHAEINCACRSWAQA